MATTINPDQYITPYLSPSQGGSPNVPVGQTGTPYSSDFIGPIPYQLGGSAGQPYSSSDIVGPAGYPIPGTFSSTPASSSGGGQVLGAATGGSGDYQSQWSALGRTGAPPVGWHGESSSSSGPSDADLNAYFNPAMDLLNQQASAYQAQYDPAKRALLDQYDQGVAGIDQQGTEASARLATQGTKAQQDQATAYANARQLYNELQQRNQAMFGGRSSAGQFAGDLLSRETAKQMGQTTNQGTNAMQALQQEGNRVAKWVTDQKNVWNQKKQEALDTLENAFRQGLLAINTQKGALEQEKAAKRIDLLQQAHTQAAQIDAADRQFGQQLALFQAQKESQLSGGSSANLGQDVYSQNRIQTGAPVVTAVYNPNGGPALYGNGSSSPAGQQASAFNQSYAYSPGAKDQYDQFGNRIG